MNLLKNLFTAGSSAPDIRSLIENGARIVDVRSPQEFAGGHNPGALNIPLPQISNRISELKKISGPIILCCASGMRSGTATKRLKQQGFEEVYNGGSWMNLE